MRYEHTLPFKRLNNEISGGIKQEFTKDQLRALEMTLDVANQRCHSADKEPSVSLAMSLNPEHIMLGSDGWLLAYINPAFMGTDCGFRLALGIRYSG